MGGIDQNRDVSIGIAEDVADEPAEQAPTERRSPPGHEDEIGLAVLGDAHEVSLMDRPGITSGTARAPAPSIICTRGRRLRRRPLDLGLGRGMPRPVRGAREAHDAQEDELGLLFVVTRQTQRRVHELVGFVGAGDREQHPPALGLVFLFFLAGLLGHHSVLLLARIDEREQRRRHERGDQRHDHEHGEQRRAG